MPSNSREIKVQRLEVPNHLVSLITLVVLAIHDRFNHKCVREVVLNLAQPPWMIREMTPASD